MRRAKDVTEDLLEPHAEHPPELGSPDAIAVQRGRARPLAPPDRARGAAPGSRPSTEARKSCPISCASAGQRSGVEKKSTGRKMGAIDVGMKPVQIARSNSVSCVAGAPLRSGSPSALRERDHGGVTGVGEGVRVAELGQERRVAALPHEHRDLARDELDLVRRGLRLARREAASTAARRRPISCEDGREERVREAPGSPVHGAPPRRAPRRLCSSSASRRSTPRSRSASGARGAPNGIHPPTAQRSAARHRRAPYRSPARHRWAPYRSAGRPRRRAARRHAQRARRAWLAGSQPCSRP